jgi:hypothetical protein
MDDDERNADMYFVERNATVTRDRRTTARPTFVSSATPAYMPAAVAAQPRVTYAGPATMFAQPQFGSQFAPQFAPNGFFGGNQPIYAQPPAWGWGQQGTLGGLFSGLNSVNIGSLLELAGQGFAAIRSLPTPPSSSGDGQTDVANLTLYQQALAEHGKSDEQIRTVVHILGKLLGA